MFSESPTRIIRWSKAFVAWLLLCLPTHAIDAIAEFPVILASYNERTPFGRARECSQVLLIEGPSGKFFLVTSNTLLSASNVELGFRLPKENRFQWFTLDEWTTGVMPFMEHSGTVVWDISSNASKYTPQMESILASHSIKINNNDSRIIEATNAIVIGVPRLIEKHERENYVCGFVTKVRRAQDNNSNALVSDFAFNDIMKCAPVFSYRDGRLTDLIGFLAVPGRKDEPESTRIVRQETLLQMLDGKNPGQ